MKRKSMKNVFWQLAAALITFASFILWSVSILKALFQKISYSEFHRYRNREALMSLLILDMVIFSDLGFWPLVALGALADYLNGCKMDFEPLIPGGPLGSSRVEPVHRGILCLLEQILRCWNKDAETYTNKLGLTQHINIRFYTVKLLRQLGFGTWGPSGALRVPCCSHKKPQNSFWDLAPPIFSLLVSWHSEIFRFSQWFYPIFMENSTLWSFSPFEVFFKSHTPLQSSTSHLFNRKLSHTFTLFLVYT